MLYRYKDNILYIVSILVLVVSISSCYMLRIDDILIVDAE